MVIASNRDIAVEAEIEMTKEAGFIATLPSDIIVEIFSYVSQHDCLRCMTVCRAWDQAIPQYTQQVWKQLKLDANDTYRDYQRRERCLGTHVKHVDIHATGEGHLYLLMQRLFDWGCTEVQSLDIRSFERITDPGVFNDVLQKLASHLTHVRVADNRSMLQFPHLLNACPELTHFTGLCTGFNNGRNLTSETKIPINHTTKIKHLCLNYAMDKEQLECILRKCPDLSCLIAKSPLRERSRSNSFIDLDSLFSWCPKISYLSTAFDFLFGLPEDTDAYINNSLGLRYLEIASYHPQDQVARRLASSQDTLTFLSIGINHSLTDDDWSSVFQPLLQLPMLRTLIISVRLSVGSLIALLNHCPSLERFQLNYPGLSLDSSAIRRLNTMHHLRSLTYHSSLDSECSLLTMLERFPVLEKLILSKIPLSVELPSCFEYPTRLAHLSLLAVTWTHGQGMDKDESIACFFRSLALKSNLESIQVSHGEALGYKSLRTLAMIPTLKLLTVHLDPMVRDDELLQFIKALRGTAIRTLKLVNTNQLLFAAFDALAELPLLKQFSSEAGRADPRNPQRISKKGLQQILCQSPTLTGAHFSNTVIEDDGVELARGQIEQLIKRQTPRYSDSRAGQWDTRVATMYTVTCGGTKATFNLDIKRIAIH